MLSYNFYNSILLQKLIRQFVKQGKKEPVEIIFYNFLSTFSRRRNFSALWLLLTLVELHRPVLSLQNFKTKNKIVQRPRVRSSQESLIATGLRWFKEGVLGDVSHIKKKRQLKFLRKQVKELQARVKTRGFILTSAEQALGEKLKVMQLQKRTRRRFEPSLREYILDSSRDFTSSFGFKQQSTHNNIIVESFRYRSYRW